MDQDEIKRKFVLKFSELIPEDPFLKKLFFMTMSITIDGKPCKPEDLKKVQLGPGKHTFIFEMQDLRKFELDCQNPKTDIKKTCSKCKKPILPGRTYTVDIETGLAICADCDDGLLVKGDMLLALE